MGRVEGREQKIVLRWRTRGQAEALSPTLDSVYPIDETPHFDEALKAIDEAERQVWGDNDPEREKPD